MKKTLIFLVLCSSLLLLVTGCGIYKKYEPAVEAPAGAIGTAVLDSVSGGSAVGDTLQSWRSFFTDPQLQQLIEQALANNTDLNAARIAAEQSAISLREAKMAYLPSLYFSPSGTLARSDNSAWSKTYELPLQLSFDFGNFGSLTNNKRAAKAALLQAQLYEETVRANLVSSVAQYYFYLQLLDRELDILLQTDTLWQASLETERALFENGQAYSTAVNQMESSCLDVKTQIVDTRRSIRATENALCKLLCITPRHFDRSKWNGEQFSMLNSQFSISATVLLNRPDIRMANAAMEEAFYNTRAAYAAFFPNITLSGTLGWSNSSGGIVVDPAQLFLNLVGQLSQPIFARGKIKAQYKIAQLTEEELQKEYVQTVIDAGNEVNEALADCETARAKQNYYHRQVEVLGEAYTGTHELMNNGKANYLEVLTAQESLLSAQLNEASNLYSSAQALIALYIALGGGTK